jgi:hypothetical protein
MRRSAALTSSVGCLDLILAEPPLGILALSTDGRSASRVSLARRPVTLDPNPSVLAEAIRRVASDLGNAASDDAPQERRSDPASLPENDSGGGSL